MDWIEINEDLLHEAIQEKECEELLKKRSHADPLPGIYAGLAASIRSAILANGRGRLQGSKLAIPQSLRGEAVALLRLQVLLRYNLTISEDRREAARSAEAKLSAIARGEQPFASSAVATRSTYHSRRQRFGQPGTGGLLPTRSFRPGH